MQGTNEENRSCDTMSVGVVVGDLRIFSETLLSLEWLTFKDPEMSDLV